MELAMSEKTRLRGNLSSLVGTLGIELDSPKFAGECREMRELGWYYGVYFNDIFFTMEPLDCLFFCRR